MKRILLFLTAAALLTAQSYKDLKYPPLPELKIPKIETYTLSNGMQLLLLENHELPTVRGVALVRTGNLFDPANKVGLATITGSAIRSGGTTAKTGDQLDEQLEDIAAAVEANIGESSGTVSFNALKGNADEVLGVFRDVLTQPAFREDRIELLKAQLRSGISRQNDEPQAIATREFASLIYGKDNSYGWDQTYATVDNITRADVAEFYKRYFFPANVLLAVTGDFSAPEMKTRLEALFAGWTVQQPKVPPFPKVNHKAVPGTYVITKPDVTQTTFAIGQLGGTFDDKDYPALEVMADILGGGFRSRLFSTVRTRLGYAYNIFSDWGANYDHPGIFQISGSTKSASTTDAIRVSLKEVARIRTEEVTEAELETAKQAVLNSFVFSFDTPGKTLNRLLQYKYFGYPDDFLFRYQKAVASVTRADILRVAKARIDPAALEILAVGNPKDFSEPLSKLGLPVKPIDISIAEPKAEAPIASKATLEAGRALLKKVQQASGGTAKLTAIKDYSQTLETQVEASAGGLKAEQLNRAITSGIFRQDATYPFGKVSVYYDGTTGWIKTPQGETPLPEAQAKQISGEVFRTYILLLLSDSAPNRKVNLAAPGVLEISDDRGNSVRLTINPDTNLPVKEEYQAGPTAIEQDFVSFSPVEGLQLPSQITILQGGKKFAVVTVKEMKLNIGLTAEQLKQKP